MRPSIANEFYFTFWFITVISIILLLIITGAMLYFVYKYAKKRHPVPSTIEGNTTIEIIWTVIPVILVLIMFFVSWTGFKNMRDVPKDAMQVSVNGQMWKWSFEYDNKKKSDTLFLPANTDVKFNLHSIDVIHSFFLPAFRVKEDVVPGRANYYWIRTNDVANYYAACAEYCGLNHSYMYATVRVIPEEEFRIWKNYFPPDTTKKDSLKTTITNSVNDSVKTKLTDSTKHDANTKTDSIKKNSNVPDMKKPDSLKK